jgi:HigB_toxin, RelE-like toxic component of a toxin-antitoxin system
MIRAPQLDPRIARPAHEQPIALLNRKEVQAALIERGETWINYSYRVVYVRFVGTHKQYDAIDAQTV